MTETKRLFFGCEVQAPWPSPLPPGRLLDEKHRHVTLAFLGNIPYAPLKKLLEHFPKPSLRVGSVGHFDSCLVLPPRHPNVVAWHMLWHENTKLIEFQKMLSEWLRSHEYTIETREWKPHVTLCRQPFNAHAWLESFSPLPFYTTSIHLYESTGNLAYVPIWSYSIPAPFEELEHTADIAFLIRGESLQQLYRHAFVSLAFKAPEFLGFYCPTPTLNSLDDVIIELNQAIAQVDSAIGSPFKAVSFHGELVTLEDTTIQWEMIVDV